jgi:hypothetical protein
MAIIYRNTKGSPLTYTELDNNFFELESGITGGTLGLDAVLVVGNETDGSDLIISSGDTLVINGSISGLTAETLAETLVEGNTTSGTDLVISVGDNLSILGTVTGIPTSTLDEILAEGNETGGNNLIIDSGDELVVDGDINSATEISIQQSGTDVARFGTTGTTISPVLIIQDGMQFGKTGPKFIKVEYTITNWNMNVSAAGTATFNVAHGLGASFVNIREVSLIVQNDAVTTIYDSTNPFATFQTILGVSAIDTTNIVLGIRTGTAFDSTDFDGSGTRGWVTITLNV